MRPIIVGFRLSKIEKKLLARAAKKRGCPISDFVRWALHREFTEIPKTNSPAGGLNQEGQ
jgi:hypothetical protein